MLLLFLNAQLMGVQAAARLLPRQGPVPLWGACNFPSQGINGPLPCASGSECICKDDSTCIAGYHFGHGKADRNPSAYAQCREEVDNSWAADPSWQCQQPGDPPISTLPPADSAPAQPVVAAAASSPAAAIPTPGLTSNSGTDLSTVPAQVPSSDNAGTQAATQGNCDSTSAPSGWEGVASTSVSFPSTVPNVYPRTRIHTMRSTMAGWAPLANVARHHGNGLVAAECTVALSIKGFSMVNSMALVSRIVEQPVVLAMSSPQVASTPTPAASQLAQHSLSRLLMLAVVVGVNGVGVLAMISRIVLTVACILISRLDHREVLGSRL